MITKTYLGSFLPIEAHQVYARDVVLSREQDELFCKGILTLRKYTPPSQDDVVDYLQKKAQELRNVAKLMLPNQNSQEIKSLDDLIKALPDSVITDIAQQDEDCIKFIRKNTSAMSLKPEEKTFYIVARFGIVPNKDIEDNKENISSPLWYDVALSHNSLREQGLGEQFKLQLSYEQNLPSRADIEVLLRHGTHGSKTLEINRVEYDLEEVSSVIEFLYNNYNINEEITKLRDDSDSMLEKTATEPIIELHNLIMRKIAETKKEQEELKELRKKFGGKLIIGR